MLKRTSQLYYQIEQLVDGLIAVASFTLAIALRRSLHQRFPEIFPMFDALWQHGWLYLLLAPIWLMLFDFFGLYKRRRIPNPWETANIIVRANAVGVVLVFFLLYFFKIKHIPRVLILFYAIIDSLLMFLKESVAPRVRKLWGPVEQVVLVGPTDAVARMLSRVNQAEGSGVEWMGWLEEPTQDEDQTPKPPKRLGTVHDLEKILHDCPVDVVVVCPSKGKLGEWEQIVERCEVEGVDVWVATDFFRTRVARPRVDEFQDIPMLVFTSSPPPSWALFAKRMIDIVGSLVLIVLSAPLMLLIAIGIKLTSPGPVLFRQKRCTLHGRIFDMYKFRTMIPEAEQLKPQLLDRNEMVGGPVFKIRNDPRVTPFGRFLRRHSLDELPQLFNVLKGDMSLVGPRPPVPEEVAKYESWQRRRLSMRAGITCLWQISGRNELPFDEWMRLDLEYIDNWSLALDFVIMLKTPWAMIRGTGY